MCYVNVYDSIGILQYTGNTMVDVLKGQPVYAYIILYKVDDQTGTIIINGIIADDTTSFITAPPYFYFFPGDTANLDTTIRILDSLLLKTCNSYCGHGDAVEYQFGK